MDALSDITIKYADEAQERVVYDHRDYVYPADIRVGGNQMYAVVSGSVAGIWSQTKLIVFDLSARKKLLEVKVDRADLK